MQGRLRAAFFVLLTAYCLETTNHGKGLAFFPCPWYPFFVMEQERSFLQ